MSDDMGVIKPCDLCGMPYDGDEADRINAPLIQLRTSLATVKAEMDDMRKSFDRTIDREDALRRELDETRKALEQAPYQAFLNEQREHAETRKALEEALDEVGEVHAQIMTTRAALARSEARVKELEQAWAKHMIDVQDWDESFVRDFAEAEGIPAGVAACILEALRNG